MCGIERSQHHRNFNLLAPVVHIKFLILLEASAPTLSKELRVLRTNSIKNFEKNEVLTLETLFREGHILNCPEDPSNYVVHFAYVDDVLR